MDGNVVMYSTSYCGFCDRARRLLHSRGIAFQEIDVTRDPEARRKIVAETGHRTVPVILIDGQLIGGSDELARLDRAGRLDKLARASA
jgi:glutaredoxin 3